MERRTAKSRINFFYFLTYGVSFIALGLAGSALGPTLPILAEHTGVTIAQVSFLFTASSFGYLIGSVGGGRLFDQFKGHLLMFIATLLMAASFFLVPLSPYFSVLIAIMFLLGLGQGVVDVGGNVNLLWIYEGSVGPYMNALHFCFGVGAFLAPIILHYVSINLGNNFKWAFWSLSILTLPGLIGLGLLPSPKIPNKEDEIGSSEVSHMGLVALMVALIFLYVGLEMGFGGFIFTYLTKSNIANEADASFINSIFWGALTLGRLLSIPLSKKLDASKILIGNFSLATIFLIIIALFPTNINIIWVSSAGLGLALSSVFPTVLALGESRMKISGKITGLFFIGTSLGGSLVPMLLGHIYEYIGDQQIMFALTLLAIISLGVLMAVIRSSKKIGEKKRS